MNMVVNDTHWNLNKFNRITAVLIILNGCFLYKEYISEH